MLKKMVDMVMKVFRIGGRSKGETPVEEEKLEPEEDSGEAVESDEAGGEEE